REDHKFRRLVHEAFVQKRVTPGLLLAEIKRSPGHPGAPRVLAEIADGAKPTRSGKEDDLVEILRRGGAAPCATNAHVPGTPRWVGADVVFLGHKLVIELDCSPWHETPVRREFDACKRGLISDVGFGVLVLGDEDVLPQAAERTMARVWAGLLEL